MVSVIIATCNRNNLLQLAIESIARQSFLPKELIVVDDHSDLPLNTEIFDCVPPLVHCILHRQSKRRGANAARNFGLALASCDVLAFLDDDDTWTPNKLELQVSFMERSSLDFSYTAKDINYYSSGILKMNRTSFNRPMFRSPFASICVKNFVGSTSTLLIKKDALLKVGAFDEDLESMQDYDLYIRLILEGYKVDGLPLSLCHYRIDDAENSITRSYHKFFVSSLKLGKKIGLRPHLILFLLSRCMMLSKRIMSTVKNELK